MIQKIAVQLFTLREQCKVDFLGTLREISQMGYAGVQFAGFHGYDPQELKSVLDETGLKVAGMHAGLSELFDDTERLVSNAKLFGTTDVICSSIPPESRNEECYREIKGNLNVLARRLVGEGIRISYHNHAFEFETKVDGKDALSFLLEPSQNNNILAELDVYWLEKGGYDPVKYLQPYAGRMPIIHLKDMTEDDEKAFAPIGTGAIDFKAIIRCGEASGVEWYVVEQDQCRTSPIECVRTSYENLSNMMKSLTSS